MAQPHSSLPAPHRFAIRCAVAYGAALGVNGILLPFFPVWLRGLSLSDFEIGIILSLPIVLRVLSAPLVGLLADRMAERARILILCALLAVITAAALIPAQSFWVVLVLFTLQGMAFAPFTPVLESITVTGVRRWGYRYGTIRVWGSIGFVIITLVAGEAVSRFGGTVVPLGAALAYGLTLIAACNVPRLGRATQRPKRVGGGEARVLRNDLFLLMIGCTVVQSTHGMYYAFSAIHWQQSGFTGNQIGMLWSVGVLAEIAFFFLSGQIGRRLRPESLILIGSCVAVGRWILFALPLDFAPSLALQCCHAFSFAFLHFGMQQKIVETVHESQESTVQGTFFFYNGVFLAASTFASGLLYRQFGQDGYFVMAAVAVIGTGLSLASRKLQPQSSGFGG